MEIFHFSNPGNKTVNIMLSFFFHNFLLFLYYELGNSITYQKTGKKKSVGTHKTLTFIHLNENKQEGFWRERLNATMKESPRTEKLWYTCEYHL